MNQSQNIEQVSASRAPVTIFVNLRLESGVIVRSRRRGTIGVGQRTNPNIDQTGHIIRQHRNSPDELRNEMDIMNRMNRTHLTVTGQQHPHMTSTRRRQEQIRAQEEINFGRKTKKNIPSIYAQGADEPGEMPKTGSIGEAAATTGIASDVMDIGKGLYDNDVNSQAIEEGRSEFEHYGGDLHPSGRPMGLSTPDDDDKNAQSAISNKNSGFGIATDIAEVAATAGMLLLAGNDATINTEEPVAVDVVSTNPTIQPNFMPGWTYEERASRRFVAQTATWDATGIGAGGITLIDMHTAFTTNPVIDNLIRSFRFMKWDSITVGVHYETNGFYQGIGRIVYTPGRSTAGPNTPEDYTRIMNSGIGEEFFANENTEIELVLPYSLPVPQIDTFRPPATVALLETMGKVYIAPLCALKCPADAIQNINIQITMQINGLTLSVPQALPATGMRLESGTDHRIQYFSDLNNKIFQFNRDLMIFIHLDTTRKTDDVVRVEVAMKIAYEHYLPMAVSFTNLAQNYVNTHERQFWNGRTWQEWYTSVKLLCDQFAQAQRYLNAWTGFDREYAMTLSQKYKDMLCQLKQVKAAIHMIVYNIDDLLTGMRLESGGHDEIVYYPTNNKMQGRYSTTRLAGNYRPHSGQRESDTSVSYLASIWTLWKKFAWQNNQITTIGLMTFRMTSVLGGIPTLDPDYNMVNYLSTFATNWSGTFDIKLQFSRSMFHQGKVMLVWTANEGVVMNLATATNYPYVVIDVSKQNEFIIRIPNTHSRSMRFVTDAINNPSEVDSLGTLWLLPFSPAISTTNVSDTMDVLCWIRGRGGDGPDAFRIYNPCNVTTYNRGINRPDGDPAGMQLQSGTTDIVLCEDVCTGPIPIGYDEITDLRQLLSKTHLVTMKVTTATTKYFQQIGYCGYLKFPLSAGDASRYPNNYYQHIIPLFAFWNGDMDVMVQTDADILILRQMPMTPNFKMGGNAAFGAGPGMIRFQNASTMVTGKLSPYGAYNIFAFPRGFSTEPDMDSQGGNTEPYSCPSTMIIDSYHSTDDRGAQRAVIYYSAAENYSLHSYVCLPDFPLMRNNVINADRKAAQFYIPPTMEERRPSLPPKTYHYKQLRELAGMKLQSREITPVEEEDLSQGMQLQSGRGTPRPQSPPPNSPTTSTSSFEYVPAPSTSTSTSNDEEDDDPDLTAEIRRLMSYADRDEQEQAQLRVLETRHRRMRYHLPPPERPVPIYMRAFQLPGRLIGSVENLEATTAHMREAAQNVSAGTAQATSTLTNITDDITAFIARFCELNPSDITTAVLLILDFVESLLINKTVKWLGFVAKLCVTLGLRTGALNGVYERVSAYFMSPHQFAEGNNNMQLQADVTPANIAMLMSITVMAIGMKSTGGFDEKKNLSLWEHMATRGREMNNMKQGVTAMVECFKFINDTIIEALLEYVYNDDPELKEQYSNKLVWQQLEEVSKLIRELHSYNSLRNICQQPERRKKFTQLFDLMNTLRHKVTMAKNRELTQSFFTMKGNFDDLISVAMDNNAESNVRMDPSHFYIVGGYGIGKSAISTAFAKGILLSQHKEVIGNIYSRTEASKFHDNYMHQYVYQVDDGGMRNDAEIAMESIQRKSNVPYILEMADLKKKGMYFTSRCIITTSNTAYPNVNGITCNDAILRRRDLVIRARMKTHMVEKKADFSHLVFDILPSIGTMEDRVLAKDLSFQQVLHMVIRKHSDLMATQAKFVKGIDPTVEIDKIYTYKIEDADLTNTIFQHIITGMATGRAQATEGLIDARSMVVNDGMILQGQTMGRLGTTISNLGTPVYTDSTGFVVDPNHPLFGRMDWDPTTDPAQTALQCLRFVAFNQQREQVLVDYVDELHDNPDLPWMDKLETFVQIMRGYGIPASKEYISQQPYTFVQRVAHDIQHHMEEQTRVADELMADHAWERLRGPVRDPGLHEDHQVAPERETIPLTMPVNPVEDQEIVWTPVDEESPPNLGHLNGVGIRYRAGVMEIVMQCENRDIICRDLDDPMVNAALAHIAAQAGNVSTGELTRYLNNPREGMRWYHILANLPQYARANSASLARALLRQIVERGLDVVGFYFGFGLNERIANWNHSGLMGASYRRATRRLDEFDARTRDVEHRMLRMMPLSFRISYTINRITAIVAASLSAAIYEACTYVMEKIGQTIKWLIRKIYHASPAVKISIAVLFGGYMLYRLTKKDDEKQRKLKQKDTENLVTEGDTMRIQDHHHLDVPDDGKRYVHVHLCDKCNGAFTHTHKKHSYEFSITKDHLCNRCYQRKLKKAAHDLTDGRKMIDIPDIEDEIELEETGKTTVVVTESVTTNSSPKPRSNITRLEEFQQESVTTNSAPKMRTNIVRLENKPTLAEAMEIVKKHTQEVRLEGNTDPNTMDIATRVFTNQGLIWRGTRVLSYLGIFGRTIIVPGHLFLPVAPTYTITVRRLGMDHNLTIFERHLKRLYLNEDKSHHNEYLVVDLTEFPAISSFADIRNQFVSETDVGKIAGSAVLLQIKNESGSQIQKLSTTSSLLGEVHLSEDGAITGFARGVKYFVPTVRGDCGSVVMVMNPQIPAKIVGLHSMGHATDNYGYGFLVTSEMVNSIELKLQCANGPPLEYLHTLADEIATEDLPYYTPQGRHIVLGVSKEREIPSPLKSDIIPSPIFDKAFNHTTEPVCLTGKDPRNESKQSPLINSLEKFDTISGGWDYIDRVISREHSLKEFLRHTEDYGGPRRLLTMDEAINGIPGYIEPLNMRTSAGYPYILKRPAHTIGKSGFFTYTLNEDGSKHYTPKLEMQEAVNSIILCAKTEGWCKDNYYLDWLKDERRKIEKVRLGKTRMFNIHNCAWLIVNRMYFGAVLAAYNYAGHKNGSTIGINMHGPDVTELITFLKTAGDNWWDLDVANFDGTASPECVYDALYVFKGWIRYFDVAGELVGIELDVIGESFYWRIHICGVVIYIPVTGIPSGQLLTATIDTEVNKQRRKKAWRFIMRTFKKHEFLSLDTKEKLARDVGNGDDILGAVNKAVADYYNPENISAYWQRHGVTATPPTKEEGGTLKGFRTWDQVTYLKCHFAHHEVYPSLYVAKMNINTIKELANWIRTSSDDMEALRSNVSDMEQFLYPHGQQVYYGTLGEVQKAMMEIGQQYHPTSYDYYDELYRSAHEIA